jgi:hypothetical protein
MDAINQRNHRIFNLTKGLNMVIETIIFSVGVLIGAAIVYVMMLTSPIHSKKQSDNKKNKDNRYETVNLDTGKYIIPEYADGDEYNRQVNGYDIHIRENFEAYIRDNVQKWWNEYANNRRKELAPLARTICKYVKVEPVRLKGSWSSDWYAYVKQDAFKVKVRYVTPYFNEQYNMELRITNTDIKENNDEFQ